MVRLAHFQASEAGPHTCVQPQLHCDGGRCVDPGEMCDGTAQCDSGVDEAQGFCTQ